jgi:hypothetical protein
MAPRLLDFVRCKCGHPTPLRPSTLAPEETDPRWKETDDEPVAVACIQCKRVYSAAGLPVESILTEYGVSPYDPEAPMRVFRVFLECDEIGCNSPLRVIAVRKSDTTVEALEKEKRTTWTWRELKCPSDHPISWPQWHDGEG